MKNDMQQNFSLSNSQKEPSATIFDSIFIRCSVYKAVSIFRENAELLPYLFIYLFF